MVNKTKYNIYDKEIKDFFKSGNDRANIVIYGIKKAIRFAMSLKRAGFSPKIIKVNDKENDHVIR